MRTSVMMITPRVAKRMLESNKNNRRIRKNKVESYAEDMKLGRWKANGEPIVFDETGELKDGQHRLHAVIAADMPVKMLVVRDVKKEDACNYDAGAKRSTVDLLRFGGTYDDLPECLQSTIAVAIANFLLTKCGAPYNNTRSVSPSATAEFIADYQDCIRFACRKYDSHHKSCVSGVRTAPVWAAIASAYECGYNESKLCAFCDALLTGEMADKSQSPIIRLRNWLISNKAASSTMRQSAYMRTQYALKAYEEENSNAMCCAARTEYYKIS